MIRRRVGNDFFLITQNDHALLAGQFARHIGNNHFARMSDTAILATNLHDAGWPLHDDHPTLNLQSFPIDVFESTREIALKVWPASADRAQAADPYAGLLVSIHVLALSVFATTQSAVKHSKFDISQMTDQFAMNKFQHREVERQETLRRQLGMRTDLPLLYGLTESIGADKLEDQFTFDFRLLQAMDLISLALCCAEPPTLQTNDVHPHVGAPAIKLQMRRINQTDLTIGPWPFNSQPLQFEIPYRRVKSDPFPNNASFDQTYASAPTETLSFTLRPA